MAVDAERPDLPLPGGDWPSVDAARAWLIAEEKRLGWTHHEWSRAYYNIHCSGSCRSGTRPEHSVVDKTKLDRFKAKGRSCIPDWLYWMPLAIQRVERLGWERGDKYWADAHILIWDQENIPGYLPPEEEDENDYFGVYLSEEETEFIRLLNVLDDNQRAVARFWLDNPDMLMWWGRMVIAADQGNEPVKKALDFLLSQKFD